MTLIEGSVISEISYLFEVQCTARMNNSVGFVTAAIIYVTATMIYIVLFLIGVIRCNSHNDIYCSILDWSNKTSYLCI